MKKTARILAILMMIAVLTISLASCAKTLKGSYSNTLGSGSAGVTTTYTFDGNKFTKTVVMGIGTLSNTTKTEGTYEITEDPENSDQLVIVFTVTDGDNTTTKSCSLVEGEENGVKYIKIDGAQFNKDEK